MNKTEKTIAVYILSNGGEIAAPKRKNVEALAERLGISYRTVYRALDEIGRVQFLLKDLV